MQQDWVLVVALLQASPVPVNYVQQVDLHRLVVKFMDFPGNDHLFSARVDFNIYICFTPIVTKSVNDLRQGH